MARDFIATVRDVPIDEVRIDRPASSDVIA